MKIKIRKTFFLIISIIITSILLIENTHAECERKTETGLWGCSCPSGWKLVSYSCEVVHGETICKCVCEKCPTDGGGGGGGGGDGGGCYACTCACCGSVASSGECKGGTKDRNRDCWNSATNSWDFSGCSVGNGVCLGRDDIFNRMQNCGKSVSLYLRNGGYCEDKYDASYECDEWNPGWVRPYQKEMCAAYQNSTQEGCVFTVYQGYCNQDCIFQNFKSEGESCFYGFDCASGNCLNGVCAPRGQEVYYFNTGQLPEGGYPVKSLTQTGDTRYTDLGYWRVTLNWPVKNLNSLYGYVWGSTTAGHLVVGLYIKVLHAGSYYTMYYIYGSWWEYPFGSDKYVSFGTSVPSSPTYITRSGQQIVNDFSSNFGFTLSSADTISEIGMVVGQTGRKSKGNWYPVRGEGKVFYLGFSQGTPPPCNNNGICESGENQDSCPNDCKTIVSMQPNVDLVPGQPVAIAVEFYDSRYLANHDVKIDLTIDGQTWSSEDCWINGKKWSEMGWSGMSGGGWSCSAGKCSGMHAGHSVNITSTNGYGKIEAECKIPVTATAFTHVLQATPTIY